MKKLELIISICILGILISCEKYNIKEDGVYYQDWNEGTGKSERLIPDADPKSFETLDDNLYAKDKYNVYYKGNTIQAADPNTFRTLEGGYAVDKNRAFYYGNSIESSSSKDFKILDGYFSTDYKDVYYRTKPLKISSKKNFKFLSKNNLNDRWSTDGNYYWFNNFKVPSNEYDQIELLDEDAGFSRDSKNVYYLNRNLKYNEDGKRILDTLDIESFEILNFIEVRDKFGCINIYHGREDCE